MFQFVTQLHSIVIFQFQLTLALILDDNANFKVCGLNDLNIFKLNKIHFFRDYDYVIFFLQN